MFGLVLFMVFNATFNYISVISWRSVLFFEKTGVPGENHIPAASHWHLAWAVFELTTLVVIATDCIGSYAITTMTDPNLIRN